MRVLGPAALIVGTLLFVLLPSPAGATHDANNEPPLVGANAYPQAVCEKSTEANLTTKAYANQRNASTHSAESLYTGTVIMADDKSHTGSDNVTIGYPEPFSGIRVKMNTAGVSGSVSWRYWNGVQWKTLNLLSDKTNMFTAAGTNTALWKPPTDWTPRKWIFATGLNNCGKGAGSPGQASLYYIQVVSGSLYDLQPLADVISLIVPNLEVKVNTELGDSITGLTDADFEITEATDLSILSFSEPQAGVYHLALDALSIHDVDYKVAVKPLGFARSTSLSTGSLTPTLKDATSTPLTVPFSVKVIVKDEDNQTVPDATVKLGSNVADAVPAGLGTHYFQATAAAELSVTAPGYEPFSTAVDSAARNVFPSTLQQTVVTLGGNISCAAGTQVAAGAIVRCHGLHRLASESDAGAASATPTSSRPITFSFPNQARSTAGRTTTGPTYAPVAACEASVAPSSGEYSKSVGHVATDTLVRLCMDQQQAVGVERVDVALGLEAQQVELRVEPVQDFRTEWSSDGIDAPPGDYHFGFLTVGIRVGGNEWTGPVQATTFRFHVTKDQLAESGLRPENVQVYRWDGDAWEAVPTSVDTETAGDYALSASAPGQGLFAVSGVSAAHVPAMPVWPWILIGFVALGLVGLGVAAVVRRRHHLHEVALDQEPTPPSHDAPGESKAPRETKIPQIR